MTIGTSVNFFGRQPTPQAIGATLNDANLGQQAAPVNLTPSSSAGMGGMSPDMMAKLAQMMQSSQTPAVDNTTYAAAPIQGLGQISMSDLPPIPGY